MRAGCVALLLAALAGCSGDDGGGDDDDVDDGGTTTTSTPVIEPKLGASCDEATAPCPEGLLCFLELGCIVETCAGPGPGQAYGCPDNGFCYTVDSSGNGYCARTCTSDADCTAVNPALVCLERSATEGFGVKICIPPP